MALPMVLVLAACGDDDPAPAAVGLAARGEAAFYDTLFGVKERSDEAIALYGEAVRRNPQDGTSWLHLGMTHLLRFSRSVRDFQNATAGEKSEIAAATSALDRAVPLLPEDRRVPGFRAAAAYSKAVVEHDSAGIERGLQLLREAIDLYPEFNNFDFIGTVGAVVSPQDPLYAEVMRLVGNPLDVNAPCTPFNQPEICGNLGKAAHNTEGAFLLFGDLFAKAGNRSRASGLYRFALNSFETTGGEWRFKTLIQQRLQSLDQRIATYQDDDPSNDPPIAGYREEACAICHYK